MGYTTNFSGKFSLNKKLDKETHEFLTKLSETRRMKRNIKGYGVDGEFFVDGSGFMGQDDDKTVIDHNTPPRTQPSLWCQWRPSKDGKYIGWDRGEKFYSYINWIQYIIQNILAPKGYKLDGKVQYEGENQSDTGTITIKNNKVSYTGGAHGN